MKGSVYQSMRQLSMMQDRIDGLVNVGRIEEAIHRQQQHFHQCTSFSVILFLHDSQELFNVALSAAVSNIPASRYIS